MKEPDERGTVGRSAWAYAARSALGLKLEAVADDLGYDDSTLRHAEANDHSLSNRLWRRLVPYYLAAAKAQDKILPARPPDTEKKPEPAVDSGLYGRMDALVRALGELVHEMQLYRAEQAAQLRGIEAGLADLPNLLGDGSSQASSEPATPEDDGAPRRRTPRRR